MKVFIVLSVLVAVGLAKPSNLPFAPLAYAKLVPGAPIGLDGRVVDTPEVSYAKAEHAAAHINEKLSLASEAVKSADLVLPVTYTAAAPIAAAPAVLAAAPAAVQLTKYTAGGAPIGLDGRVVDTPEVAYAKAEHAAAHINEKIEQSSEALKSAQYISYAAPAIATTYSAAAPAIATTYAAAPAIAATYAAAPAIQLTKYTAGGAPIGLDGRVVDTPEVAYAKAEHAAAHINEKIEQGAGLIRSSPLLISSYAAPAYATGYVQHYY